MIYRNDITAEIEEWNKWEGELREAMRPPTTLSPSLTVIYDLESNEYQVFTGIGDCTPISKELAEYYRDTTSPLILS